MKIIVNNINEEFFCSILKKNCHQLFIVQIVFMNSTDLKFDKLICKY